ncbi:MAG: MFS transporter [Betaproteobacteria bacterium]|nr:MFS transporter [Betaproteobacteria bacterium]
MDISARYRRLRRLAYALGAAAFILAFFHRVAPGAIAADLRASFGASATMLGFIGALYFYPYAAMQLPSGVLADSVGPRRLFTAGSVVAGIGSLLFALAPNVVWLLAGRALVGLGVAVAFVSVLKLIASWYSEREFGTWVGVLMLLGNLGAVLAAYPLAWVTQYVSWRDVFLATGGLSLAIALCIWLWVHDDPRDAGLPSMHSFEGTGEEAGAHTGWWDGLAKVAANRHTWPGFFMHMGMVSSYLTFAGLWAVPYLTEGLGFTRANATLHVTAMILGFALSAFAVGAASDRMGRRLPLLRALSLLYLASWAPWVMGWSLPVAASLAAFMLMGVGIAGASLAWALAKELNPPALSGTATSLVNTGGFLGTALFQPLVGWVLDRNAAGPALEGYRSAATVLAVIAALGVAAAFRIRETGCRNVYVEAAPR